MRKIAETENGFLIDNTSTNEEWHKILEAYQKVKCIICNANTSKYFKPSLFSFGKSCITINNKIPDMVVYINRVS